MVFGMMVFLQPLIKVFVEMSMIALTSCPLLSLLVYLLLEPSTIIEPKLEQLDSGLATIEGNSR